jgi:DNA mismatch repair protein MutS2
MSPPLFDILHEIPRRRLSPKSTRETLTFAFAAGCGSDPFERLLSRLTPTPTSFSSECFATDLFLDAFIDRCLRTTMPGTKRSFHRSALRTTLASPPRHVPDVQLRQAILRDLEANPSVIEQCQQAWQLIDSFRLSLESADLGKRPDASVRRLEILRQLDSLIRFLSEAFTNRPSPLCRIGADAVQALSTEGFAHLAQLLDYEDNRTSLTVGIRIGRDGEIRRMNILSHQESRTELESGKGRGWLDRLAGYWSTRTLRRREVVGRFIETVFDGVEHVMGSLLELQLGLEFYLAIDGMRQLAHTKGLSVCIPELVQVATGQPFTVRQLYNPFLLLEERPPVPCDVTLASPGLVLITGPNSGGKTRLLQAVGLVQLMAQCGAWVPGRKAVVPHRDGLFVSLVHEVSADQHEGRLGTELLRIRRLFERLGFDQMVLLDELCSGTNPSEGEGIVHLVISLLEELRPQALITTHFLQFAQRLEANPPAPSLSFQRVVLDSHQQPLYQFEPGVASTSLAEKTAERLGVTREALQTLIHSKAGYVGG